MVPGGGARAAPERGGHRRGLHGGGGAGGAGGGPDRRGDPGQPGGPRRRDRLARGRAQRLRLDLQHRDGAALRARRRGNAPCWRRPWATTYAGVLVSDFYAAYTTYEGRHQYCWAHLLRDVRRAGRPAPGGRRGARLGGRRPRPLRAGQGGRGRSRPRSAAAAGASGRATKPSWGRCARRTWAPTRPRSACCASASTSTWPSSSSSSRTRRCRRPTTPPSAACATWSPPARSAAAPAHPAGTATKMTLATLFGTWRLQGLNPLEQCRPSSPNLNSEQFTSGRIRLDYAGTSVPDRQSQRPLVDRRRTGGDGTAEAMRATAVETGVCREPRAPCPRKAVPL